MRTRFFVLALSVLCAGCASFAPLPDTGPAKALKQEARPHVSGQDHFSPRDEYESHRLYLNQVGAQVGARRISLEAVGPYLAASGSLDLAKEWNLLCWGREEAPQQRDHKAGVGSAIIQGVGEAALQTVGEAALQSKEGMALVVAPLIVGGIITEGLFHLGEQHKQKMAGILERFNQRLAVALGLANVSTSAHRALMPPLKDKPALIGRLGGSQEDWVDDYWLENPEGMGWVAGGQSIGEPEVPAYMRAQGAMDEAARLESAHAGIQGSWIMGAVGIAGMVAGGVMLGNAHDLAPSMNAIALCVGGLVVAGLSEIPGAIFRSHARGAIKDFNASLPARVSQGTLLRGAAPVSLTGPAQAR
jgi:hypothetical protein